jgi:hypothetical protein
MDDVAIDPTEEHPLLAVSGLFGEQECDHKGHYRMAGGAYCAIRMCINCGQSWRLFTKGDFPGDIPAAEWQEIKEPMEVKPLVTADYDHTEPYDDEEIEDDE